MSDRLDRGFARVRPWALVAAVLVAGALAPACTPHDQGEQPPDPPPPVPCTREVAVAADTVVIAAGACNPGCIHVPAGAEVLFLNGDPTLYVFASPPPPAPARELVQVPGRAGMTTLPLDAPGTYVYEALQWPAATVTVFVE
ncbi:MAG TPA: hypothetical protein VFM53_15170 [Anaeromyxobacteraceae bacterium]|nr:hypothetical protein [Anaeromyxobacteraceae bacterium]